MHIYAYLSIHKSILKVESNETGSNKINGVENLTEEKVLVTLVVKSLYTNIPNHEGIQAAKEALNSVLKKPIATKVIIKFLFPILTLSNFIFNEID